MIECGLYQQLTIVRQKRCRFYQERTELQFWYAYSVLDQMLNFVSFSLEDPLISLLILVSLSLSKDFINFQLFNFKFANSLCMFVCVRRCGIARWKDGRRRCRRLCHSSERSNGGNWIGSGSCPGRCQPWPVYFFSMCLSVFVYFLIYMSWKCGLIRWVEILQNLLTVVPVIGLLSRIEDFKPVVNADEVDALFDAPLEMFLQVI